MEFKNEIMDKRYLEIDMGIQILDYERQILMGVNIPSLLPMNIINSGERKLMCFNTYGYKSIGEWGIHDVETLCRIIKSFIHAIIRSEQYLLSGSKHFTEPDMVFLSADSMDVKLVFGNSSDTEPAYADNRVIVSFLKNLKSKTEDTVFIQIINNVLIIIEDQNPRFKRLITLIEELERKWYCRNLI